MVLQTLKSIYRPKYLLLNAAVALVYFYIVKWLITIQNRGIFIAIIPVYMLALLSITSAITFTIAIYTIGNTRRNQAKATASTASVVSVAFSGLVGGCGCQAGFFMSLAGIVTSASGAFALNTVLAENSFYIISAIVVVNIIIAIYYLNKLSKPKCAIKGGSREAKKEQKGK